MHIYLVILVWLSFPVAKHEYKINLYRHTKVKLCTVFSGSVYGFDFLDFGHILAENCDAKHPLDVIGDLYSCGKLDDYSKNGRLTKRISFELEDLEGRKVNCTLWGTFAQEFYESVSVVDLSLHVIIIIQHGKLGTWQEKPVVSNGYFGTRVFVNSDVEEISTFRQRILSNGEQGSSPHRVLELTDNNFLDFVVKTERKNIDEAREIQKADKYVVIATIVCVQKDEDWYYLACGKCNKGVEHALGGDENEVWFCTKCNKKGVDVQHRFKVKIRVQDGTGAASFILFDHEVSKVIGKSSCDLFDKLKQDGDVDSFPEDLNELVGKKFAFKIDVAPYNLERNYRVYTVVKLTNDERILSNLMNKFVDGQTSKSGISVDCGSSSQGLSPSCITQGNDDVAGQDNIKTPTSNGKRSITINDVETVSQLSPPKKQFAGQKYAKA